MAACRGDRLPELVQDLVLAHDDRIPPDSDRDRMTDNGLVEEAPTSLRHLIGVGGRLLMQDPVRLDAMTGLEDETGAASGPLASAETEGFALHGRHVPRVCDERDQAPRVRCRHRVPSTAGSIREGAARERPPRAPTGRTPWPVIVATSS